MNINFVVVSRMCSSVGRPVLPVYFLSTLSLRLRGDSVCSDYCVIDYIPEEATLKTVQKKAQEDLLLHQTKRCF